MMIKRLREMPTAEQLAVMYAKPHQHRAWADHRVRVDVTVAMAAHLLNRQGATVADLSCGDAAIARRLQAEHGVKRVILGDIAPGYEFTGPIEKTVDMLRFRQADLFVCSETIEHLDDPATVLQKIRQKTNHLILSTPDGEVDDSNPEHIWGWDAETVGTMLKEAGFSPVMHTTLDLRPGGYMYSYQIWGCV